ncbi:MAG: hypothetical protein KBE91_09955 [Bacteroidia bacterium]|nr:hypothetical protein [Bacteroidia bacterium]MBP9689923.1 hypothetical protein [Bacteroidia bacterium]
MSLLGNQNNEFEKKLKQQLNDTDYKPSDSLWDRIDQEVNRPDFEQKIEGKVGNYSIKPSPQTWEQIEAQLPPEPSSKSYRKILWIPFTVLLFIGSFGVGYFLNWGDGVNNNSLTEISEPIDPTKNNIQPSFNDVVAKPKYYKNTITQTVTDNIIDEPTQTQIIKTTPISKKSLSKKAHPLATKTTRNNYKNGVGTKSTPLKLNKVNANLNKGEVNLINTAKITVSNINNESDNNVQPTITSITNNTLFTETPEPIVIEPNTIQEPLIESSLADSTHKGKPLNSIANNEVDTSTALKLLANNSNDQKPSKLSLSIMIGAHYSLMQLSSSNPSLQQHINLRNQIESPEVDWSGGFLIDYEWKKLLFSTGVQFTSFSMGMTYGTTSPTQTMQTEANSSVATTDSVTANGAINTRIKYSWNEIPFLVTYRFTPTKRLGIEAKVGISYAIISTVDAALVGPNNVGVFLVKNKESFPYLTNSFFAQTYLGVSYQVNSAITLTCMPYLRYSLNDISGANYAVKQQPYMLGLSLGLRKHF